MLMCTSTQPNVHINAANLVRRRASALSRQARQLARPLYGAARNLRCIHRTGPLMHFSLTEEQAAIQETALTFAKERLAPSAAEWDEKSHFPVDVIRETAALGMAAIYVPAEIGGSGLSRLDGALIMEALAYGCPSISAYISIHNMVAWMVGKYASDAQRPDWMGKLASM